MISEDELRRVLSDERNSVGGVLARQDKDVKKVVTEFIVKAGLPGIGIGGDLNLNWNLFSAILDAVKSFPPATVTDLFESLTSSRAANIAPAMEDIRARIVQGGLDRRHLGTGYPPGAANKESPGSSK